MQLPTDGRNDVKSNLRTLNLGARLPDWAESDMEGCLDRIRKLCGSRSAETVLKRANSLLRPLTGISSDRPLGKRCRWSDVRCVNTFELDIDVDQDRVDGFLNFSAYTHKTAAQVARHGLPLPLVAPIWGLTSPAWGLEWKRIAQEAESSLDQKNNSPLLAVPTKSGRWGQRSVTSKEASKWLVELLSKISPDLHSVSSHSLKCTTLSWLAKAGSSEPHRLILGHHSSGKGSLEVYSRDLLAAPFRTLEEVLRQVRIGALQPDKTRSGMIRQAAVADCRDIPQSSDQTASNQTNGPDPQKADSSSSSGSSSSSSSTDSESDSSGDEGKPRHWTKISSRRSHIKAWGEMTMYQHKSSKIVHVESDSETRQFQCGIVASDEHEIILETTLLDTRKCKRCQRAIGES
eukprot:s203_g4.t1